MNTTVSRHARALASCPYQVAIRTSADDERRSSFSSTRLEEDVVLPEDSLLSNANPSISTFLVGTTELNARDNEILTAEYDEEKRSLNISQPGFGLAARSEIWHIAPRPLLNNAHDQKQTSSAAKPGDDDEYDEDERHDALMCWNSPTEGRGMFLVNLSSAAAPDTPPREVENSRGAVASAWDKSGERFCSVHVDGSVRLFDSRGRGEVKMTFKTGEDQVGRDVCFDPHNERTTLIAAIGGRACGFDVRAPSGNNKPAFEANVMPGRIGNARAVDANPNRPFFFLAAGDDGSVRFWDARKVSEPALQLHGGHSHWVTRAKYNPFHDQLVLSSSADGTVCLWRATSVSSTPLVDLGLLESEGGGPGAGGEEEVQGGRRGRPGRRASASLQEGGARGDDSEDDDGLIKTFEEHSESVYGLTWSATDAWVFASLSYDGKILVRTVPAADKYRILL